MTLFFRQLSASTIFLFLAPATGLAQARSEAPYPPSPVIAGIEWHRGTQLQFGLGSDQWPMTTGADGSVYGAWGDGWGWAGEGSPETKRSIGVTRISGTPPELRGEDLWGAGPGRGFGKPEALIALGDTVRMFWTKGDSKWDHTTWGASSFDGGRTWELSTSRLFTRAPPGFRVRGIVQYGPGYEGAPDDFVYVYFGYNRASDLYLARVPRGRIFHEPSYDWFAGADTGGGARWTASFEGKVPAFHDANGYVWHIGISYLPAVQRYLLVKPHYDPRDDRDVELVRHSGVASLGVFDAPAPWGPWSTVYYEDSFLDDYVKFAYMIPTAYLQPDADAFWLGWSGWPEYDNVNFIRGTLKLRSGVAAESTPTPSTSPGPLP